MSQITVQAWETNRADSAIPQSTNDDITQTVNGIVEYDLPKAETRHPSSTLPGQRYGSFTIWSHSRHDLEKSRILRGSFVSGNALPGAASSASKVDVDNVSVANELLSKITATLHEDGGWLDDCCTQQSARPLKEKEESVYHDLVNEDPERYRNIGLRRTDRDTAQDVLICQYMSTKATHHLSQGGVDQRVVWLSPDDETKTYVYLPGSMVVPAGTTGHDGRGSGSVIFRETSTTAGEGA
ncbi:hypothetical protein L198_05190 [Cryptococcus wingfieldii CBS 7118]|uniref:Uncharacterized protein n=1 Tax=Cryptococcus wingfieldii CBS 7118 TaxID=1295528 RepID=A0A1E3J0D2_9TREE|nr:hypothetical protein L198_05190 [Cryptococcus wingfieldii CBS 7118]ODN94333.1 hypothetical protein L198_05190 [Cryptococcus wingfieldii CBS 7118]